MRERLKANGPVDGEDLERRPIASVNDLVVIYGVEAALNLRPRDDEDSSISNLYNDPQRSLSVATDCRQRLEITRL